MKRCPSCQRTYTDPSLNFCLEDGTPLTADAPPPQDLNATVRYQPPRDTADPPPTEIYRPDTPVISPAPPPQPRWSPAPTPVARKKSNAIWWILGGLSVLAVLGIGLVVLVIALASMANSNGNDNSNGNTRVVNRNANANLNGNTNANANAGTSALPASFEDTFSEAKWGTGDSKFGRIWYADDEYHMS